MWGGGFILLFIIPKCLWTPYIGLLLIISNIHWMLYSINKDKNKINIKKG